MTVEISRREFLRDAGLFLSGATALFAFQRWMDTLTEADKNPEGLANLVQRGLEREWKSLTVVPGFLIAISGVRYFRHPSLDKDSEVKVSLGADDSLGILRPFLVSSTIKSNAETLTEKERHIIENTPVKPGTLGFWLPNSLQLVYCNYNDSAPYTQLFIRALSVTDSESPLGPPGEQIQLDGRYKNQGKVYPYITKEHGEYFDEPNLKLCSQSTYYRKPQDLNNVLKAYLRDANFEPINITHFHEREINVI